MKVYNRAVELQEDEEYADLPAIYNYNPDTKEFVSEGVADINPVNPYNYIVPQYATTLQPPEAQDNKARIFINNTWEYVDDYRGMVVKDLNSDRKTTITELGVKPDGVVFPQLEQEPKELKKYKEMPNLSTQVEAIMIYLATVEDLPDEVQTVVDQCKAVREKYAD